MLGLDDVVQLVAGYNHFCARDEAGAVFRWGSNKENQIGPGADDWASEPVSLLW